MTATNGSAQFIHCGLYNVDGSFINWLTATYALNQLEERKKLWKDIENISTTLQGPWMLMGDFNNVLKAHDRIGGTMVRQNEYCNLVDMMRRAELFEVDSIGDYYTWHNKHTLDPIYSRIDRVLGNLDWLRTFTHVHVEIMEPNVSDHALLQIRMFEPVLRAKFINCVVDDSNFLQKVEENWTLPLEERLCLLFGRSCGDCNLPYNNCKENSLGYMINWKTLGMSSK